MPEPTHWSRLGKRISVLHSHWQAATSDLSIDQVNFHERDGVLPIAFSLLHAVSVEDRMTSKYVFDRPTVWESGEWTSKIGGTLLELKKGTPVDIAESIEFENLGAWIDYQSTVFAQTESVFQDGSDRYDDVLFPNLPDQFSTTSLAIVSGPDGPVYLGDLIEVFVYAHGSRHLGEIEHARSLVGLQGVS